MHSIVSQARIAAVLLALFLSVLGLAAKVAPTSATGPLQETAEPAVPRIVGGQEADPGEWPWQVGIMHAGGTPYESQYCGASLINEFWVLTASHCTEDALNPSDIEVLIGIHDLGDPDPDFQQLAVKQIIMHPQYDAATLDFDIALLELETAADIRPGAGLVLPIAAVDIIPPAAGDLIGELATVTGWGSISARPGPNPTIYPERLREVEVPIISNEDCDDAYIYPITDNMICAGYDDGGKDSCQGDSGGPLVLYNEALSRWEQAGIVSWGVGCAAPGFPGVYTRLTQFVDWISDNTPSDVEGDFTINVAPDALEMCAGWPAELQVTLNPIDGFDDAVQLAISGLPVNVATTIAPNPVSPPNGALAMIETAELDPGEYTVTISGASGELSHETTAVLTIREKTADCICELQEALPENQCHALINLYDQTQGQNWLDDSGWGNSPQLCEWYGISCMDEQVSGLGLGSNNLQGNFPPALLGLPALKSLDLSENPLAGPIIKKMVSLPLTDFSYDETQLCAPADPEFSDWLNGIASLQTSGLVCHAVFLPMTQGS